MLVCTSIPFAITEIFQYLMLKLFTTPKLRSEQERYKAQARLYRMILLLKSLGESIFCFVLFSTSDRVMFLVLKMLALLLLHFEHVPSFFVLHVFEKVGN